ncbi:MAG TPA: single-stranded-DNA-specific exonuclease RecJ [Polyangiaceae bacterium]|jgi:single-stranded-DNA-specific exonuclease
MSSVASTLRDPRAPDLARDLGVTQTAADILVKRGFADRESAARFFDPKLAHLTSPALMKDRTEAARRITRAVRAGETIALFGDYDADGVTSAALMTDVLRTLGGRVATFLADRFEGGYGLSAPALERVLTARPSLLITCDCGTSDHPRLEEARRRGVDVVVIDHHRVPDEPLPALAFLNPHRPDCGFSYKGLASVGLALSVCAAVRAEIGVDLDLRNWLDLVALGTIADVAPLDGDNRALVRAGLTAIARGTRPGIRALSEIANLVGAPLTGEDIAFRYAPRINAPGRLKKPDLALNLLLATDPHEARSLALELDAICDERKKLDRSILVEAEEELADPALAALPVIVLGREAWHPGVVGIVAGRLASKHGKPTVIVGAGGRGSVRGPAGSRLHTALSRCQDALLGFGGHEAAAGVHLEPARLEALRERFAEACLALGMGQARPASPIPDAPLALGDDPAKVFRDLERFEPCGQGNPAPLLEVVRARVASVRVMKEKHLAIEIEIGKGTLRAFGYELASQSPPPGSHVRVVGKLRRDDYRGGGAVELRMETLEPA